MGSDPEDQNGDAEKESKSDDTSVDAPAADFHDETVTKLEFTDTDDIDWKPSAEDESIPDSVDGDTDSSSDGGDDE